MQQVKKQGLAATRHADDILGVECKGREATETDAKRFKTTLSKHGWAANESKSHPAVQVSTKTRHLGFVLDSTEMSVAITPERRTKTTDRATKLMETGQWSCRQAQQITGSTTSCSAVLQGRAFRRTRRLNAFLSEHPPQANAKADHDDLHAASAEGAAELQRWMHVLEENPEGS